MIKINFTLFLMKQSFSKSFDIQYCIFLLDSFIIIIKVEIIGYYYRMTYANFKEISSEQLGNIKKIQIFWNNLDANIVNIPHINAKYKKVAFQSRRALISLVDSGKSIINASRELSINYSTAKSIFQSIKSKRNGTYKRKRYFQQNDTIFLKTKQQEEQESA